RLSGPLRDRLDLTVDVPALQPDTLANAPPGESSAAVRGRVVGARERQRARYAGESATTNSELTPAMMSRHCILDARSQRVLSAAASRLALTARAYDRVRKVARTIADLAGDDAIAADHLAEALQFRMVM